MRCSALPWSGMLPVFLCLIGTRTSTADKLFIGWFGPRGLATIVFAILVLDAKLPGNDTVILAAGWTVLLSVIAHGVTANPLVKAIGSRSREPPKVRAPLTQIDDLRNNTPENLLGAKKPGS